jgi:phage terminase large subunit-like protein
MGVNPIIDFTVPNYNCYFTGNVLNHNCGKTVSGAYEMALHLTGRYPHWWEGRFFDHPISAWAAGKTNESTRDIMQLELVGQLASEDGKKTASGTGMIPKDCLGQITWKSGITGLVDTILVKHISGGWSDLGFKTYAQGRDVFEGTKKHVVWFDEEPPLDVYTEALIRTMTTGGIIYTTFTPLEGMSETVMRFLPDGEFIEGINHEKDYTVVSMTWDDAPHIDEATKNKMYEVLPPHEKEARSKGRPSMGAGRVYPVPESRIMCDPFPIPAFWPQAYGLDVGITKTAALWGAWDKENDTVYIHSEYYQGEELPLVHSEAIKARGDWMNGVIDPASRGRNAATGERLLDIYRNYGLTLMEADNAVDAGTNIVWERLRTNKLKFFSNLPNLFKEYRLYRRDEKMKIIKKDDHLMDALRYLVVSGLDVAIMNHAKIEATVFNHLKSGHRKQRDAENDYDPSSYLS